MKKSIILIFAILLNLSLNAQWEKTNASFGGNINVLEVSGNNLFAGTDKGVYLSVDSGNSWTQMNNGLTNTAIYSIVVNGSNIFVGTGGNGVFLSSDNGSNWTAVNNGMTNCDVRSLYFSGSNLYAGTENDGIFISIDNGQSWNSINNGLINSPFRAFFAFGGAIYAGSYGAGIFKSTNNGNNWGQVNSGLTNVDAQKINAFTVLGNKLFAGTENGLYSSTSGTVWNSPSGTPWTSPSLWFPVNSLKVNGTSLYVGTRANKSDLSSTGAVNGTYGVLLSTNGGSSWTAINNGISYNPVNSLVFLSSTLIAGTSGTGIYKSQNNGTSWVSSNIGIGNAKVNSLVNYGGVIIAGTFGAGVHKSNDGGNTWSEINNGIPNYDIVSVSVCGTTLFAGTYTSGLFKSTDSGNTWKFCPLPTNQVFAGTTITFPVMIHDIHTTSNGKVYVSAQGPGEGGIFSSSDSGVSWSLSGHFTGEAITSNGTSVYVGGVYSNGPIDLAISTNNGFSWSFTPYGTLGSSPISIETLGSYLFVGTDTYGVRTSPDKGNSWNPSNGIAPYGYRINALTKYSSSIFAGTENNGVYFSNDNFTNSITVNYGLIDSNIFSLLTVGADIYAGTLNGKIWKRVISDIIQPPMNAGTISGASFVCEGQKNVNYTIPQISNAEFYIWKLPNGKVDTTKTNTINISFEANDISGNLSVYASNYFGDGQVSSQFITISKLPSVVATASKTVVCSGESVSLTGAGASTYIWDNNVSNGVSFVPSETKTYTVSGSDVKGCTTTTTVNIKVNQLPMVTISLNGPTTYCSNKLTELVASNGLSYLWNDGTTSKTIKPNQSGSYFVKVTDMNGCSASSDPVYLTVNDCASIVPLSLQSVQLFPNPTTDLLSVEVSEDLIQLTYKIMDVSGKELVSGKLNHTLNTIDVEDLATGTYFFEIENGYKSKFIKQ
jgi:photosystem II stability/assembly factor-like uncharacterized protein